MVGFVKMGKKYWGNKSKTNQKQIPAGRCARRRQEPLIGNESLAAVGSRHQGASSRNVSDQRTKPSIGDAPSDDTD